MVDTPATPPVTPPTPPNYASGDALYPTKVDGKSLAVPVKDLAVSYQFQGAAEKRLADANRIYTENRDQLDSFRRMEALAIRLGIDSTSLRTNPEAAAAEMARKLGIQPPQHGNGADNSATNDDGTDPALRALRSELAANKAMLTDLTGRLDKGDQEKATGRVMSEIKSRLSAYPLYQGEETLSRQAEDLVVLRHLADRSKPIAQVVAEVYSEHEEIETSRVTKIRDTRTSNADATRTLPPGTGTPGLSIDEMPKVTDKKDWTNGGWKKTFGAAADHVKKAYNSVK